MELIQINALIVFKSREYVRRHSYNILEHLNDSQKILGSIHCGPKLSDIK